VAGWRSVPVFISSTFRDMDAERDHLMTVVFPRLREQLSFGELGPPECVGEGLVCRVGTRSGPVDDRSAGIDLD